MLKGGCYCGKVRYEVSGAPLDSTVCHCTDCRRIAAAPSVAWFTVNRTQLRFVDGELRALQSSKGVLRCFCADCGTHLTYQHDEFPDEIDISTGSLDAPDAVPPVHHTWISQKLSWVQLADGLPVYETSFPVI